MPFMKQSGAEQAALVHWPARICRLGLAVLVYTVACAAQQADLRREAAAKAVGKSRGGVHQFPPRRFRKGGARRAARRVRIDNRREQRFRRAGRNHWFYGGGRKGSFRGESADGKTGATLSLARRVIT